MCETYVIVAKGLLEMAVNIFVNFVLTMERFLEIDLPEDLYNRLD